MARSACLTVSSPRSPVRILTASSTGITKILPSPTSPCGPVRAASASLSITASTIDACMTASILRHRRPAVGLGVPAVGAAALDLGHRDPGHAALVEHVLDLLQVFVADDRHHQLHAVTPSLATGTLLPATSPPACGLTVGNSAGR